VFAYIPSPSSGALHLGRFQLRAYGLCIALGVWAACIVAARRYKARGGDPELITTVALWGVPAGIIGARIYSVVTSYSQDVGSNPLNIFAIWHGGLGIWGGVLLGGLVAAWVVRRHGADVGVFADASAPAVPLAQAIGRWGNWFNQELYGKPTGLPWGLEIDKAHRAIQYLNDRTFQPTFLYESIWDLCVVGIVLLAERKLRLRTGSLFVVYVVAYTFGRFFTEYERIDTAHKIGPLRLNDWTSIIVFTASLIVLLVMQRRRPGMGPETTGDEPGEAARVTPSAEIDDGPPSPPGDGG